MKKFNDFDSAFNWIKQTVEKTSVAVLEPIAEEVYKDSEKYTYQDTKEMYKSGMVYSDFKEGNITLRTPYAKLRYYRGGQAGDGNRNAVPMWFEATKKQNIKKYVKQYNIVLSKIKGG